jgi:uncharacterized membrane protein
MDATPELDLALMVFPHLEGAERSYSRVRERAAGQPWLEEIAFVEHHGHDRLIVRGTVAGHYLDVDDHGDLIGPRVTKGALTGGAVGLLLGPPGMAVGFAAGGTAGGISTSDAAPRHHNALLDDFRLEIPEHSSALALLAAPAHVDQMVAALEGERGELIRHHLNSEQAEAVLAAVADAPAAG